MDKPLKPKKTILIDFDGVLNNYNGDFDENVLGKPKYGAEHFLEKLSKSFKIVIFTTRPMLKVAAWIIENGFYDYIYDITNTKIPCYVYVDDRAITFKGSYKETLADIKNFKVHWGRKTKENKNVQLKENKTCKQNKKCKNKENYPE